MLNYPVLTNIKPQVKISTWSKDGHIAHLLLTYINSKPNLCMKPNINILVIFSIL